MPQPSTPQKSSKTPIRPLSPHLQIWRWHVTMLASILNRASGIASVAGLGLLVAWLLSLGLTASGYCPQAYSLFVTLAASPLGLLVWIGLTFAGFLHLSGGIRHLVWDLGLGFKPSDANILSYISLLAPVVATIALWVCLFASGKVVL